MPRSCSSTLRRTSRLIVEGERSSRLAISRIPKCWPAVSRLSLLPRSEPPVGPRAVHPSSALVAASFDLLCTNGHGALSICGVECGGAGAGVVVYSSAVRHVAGMAAVGGGGPRRRVVYGGGVGVGVW